MTTGIGAIEPNPYTTPSAGIVVGGVLETTITASIQEEIDIGGVTLKNAEVYNGAIPGPTFFLTVGDTVIVRLVNDLPYPTGIHWHGIELQNSADGTPVTQDGVAVGPFLQPVPLSPSGGTYLYKFKVTRPGIFWYHPHHHFSTNRVFRGLYGMIIVTDPAENSLVEVAGVANTLPSAANTVQLVLSDITVCGDPGSNPDYVDPAALPLADRAEWLGSPTNQPGPTPESLCELFPMNEDGTARGAPFTAGFVPTIQKGSVSIDGFQKRTNEGHTVLTNGVNVGGRPGTPDAPGALVAGGETPLDVLSGQGLRLQIVNCATTRFFRLRLTTNAGTQVDLVRVGGEGGLLNYAVKEGGVIGGPGGFDTKYDSGEILLPPASRADVVVAIPAGEAIGSVLTLWTRDFARTGPGFSRIPTVPVMHLNVTGAVPPADIYTINGGVYGVDGPGVTKLRDKVGFPGLIVEELPPFTHTLLNPGDPADLLDLGDFPSKKLGLSSQDIQLTATGPGGTLGINGVLGEFLGTPYTHKLHIGSSRYAAQGDLPLGNILELTVENKTGAHHPFHLHGFSFQPILLEKTASPTFTWPYQEFRDNVDIPSGYKLTFRVRITGDRKLADGITLGGELGRWLFHCHIFFHAHGGMISEFVVTAPDGNEKPNVDVGGSWAYAPSGSRATRKGTFYHRDEENVSLTATLEDGTPIGLVTFLPGVSEGNWLWKYDSAPGEITTTYVYITAETDMSNRKDQTVFRLKIGGDDDGSDIGDPHIRTVDGKRFDFQAGGEFTLLLDREGMEIQTRQMPVLTANPITDSYSGLTSCVSLNTAVAARVGSHRISYQPGQQRGQLQFYLDGKPMELSTEGIDLEAHRVSTFDADGKTGLRVDYAHGAVLMVTPRFWTSHNMWFMDVSISHTQGDEGIMGRIPDSSWLPKLPSGATVGPRPEALHDRYIALYKTFANAWRVTDKTSMFVYAPGTSTATFTDEDWPAGEPPCDLKPQFEIPGLPTPVNIPVEHAEQICQGVTIDDLHANCVFDVATTGDETFAQGYLLAQDLRLHNSAVQIVGDKEQTLRGEPLMISAIVLPLTSGRPTPAGKVTFLVDGVAAGTSVKLDEKGRARLRLDRLNVGEHKIRAAYTSDDGEDSYHSSSSPNLLHTVEQCPGSTGGSRFRSWWMIWIWIILGLIAIAAYVYWS